MEKHRAVPDCGAGCLGWGASSRSEVMDRVGLRMGREHQVGARVPKTLGSVCRHTSMRVTD